MIKSLSVAADQVGFYLQLMLGGEDGIGIEFAEKKIQARQIGYACFCGVHCGQHRLHELSSGKRYSAWPRVGSSLAIVWVICAIVEAR